MLKSLWLSVVFDYLFVIKAGTSYSQPILIITTRSTIFCQRRSEYGKSSTVPLAHSFCLCHTFFILYFTPIDESHILLFSRPDAFKICWIFLSFVRSSVGHFFLMHPFYFCFVSGKIPKNNAKKEHFYKNKMKAIKSMPAEEREKAAISWQFKRELLF